MDNTLLCTEGDWQPTKVKETKLGFTSEIGPSDNNRFCSVWGDTKEECEANAHLIAASKDLYNALKELYEVDYTSGTHLYTAQLKAFAALKKAFSNYQKP